MTKFLIIILSLFELIFYTFCMVLIDDITISNNLLKLIIHFGAIIVVGAILYYILKLILTKLKMPNKKYLYLIPLWNLIIGIIFPIVLIIIIPNAILNTFSFLLLVCTVYYGLLINLVICLLNYFKD